MENLLSTVYYNPKTGFSSSEKLFKLAKIQNPGIKRTDVKKWLQSQLPYTLHKFSRKKYKRNRVLVSAVDEQWQADLADVQSIEKHNDGYKYLLTCIDLFSKYSFVIPLKSKVPGNIIEAFKTIFKTEKTEEVEFFTTKSEMKASVVERFNRTIKVVFFLVYQK